jgi:hypothetical protein
MAKASRRDFIERGLMLAGTTVAMPILAPRAWTRLEEENKLTAQDAESTAKAPYEIRSSSRVPHVPVRVIDTERMPAGRRKVLFENKETKGRFFLTYSHPPGEQGGYSHYHKWHEWGYLLFGDSALDEFTDSDQRVAPLITYREGYFLDRPAYSLHAATKTRFYHQVASSWLFMEEGDDTESFTPDPSAPPSYFAKYNPEHKQGRQWAAPKFIDTIGMQWEPVAEVPGLHIKRLVNDPSRGFRVILRLLEPGWNSSQSSQFARPYFYKQAYQFNFVLSGELKIQTYKAPGEKAEQIALSKYFYVERAPMSIFGLADGVVSERGCVWLEATYARGTSISNAPIEAPNYV